MLQFLYNIIKKMVGNNNDNNNNNSVEQAPTIEELENDIETQKKIVMDKVDPNNRKTFIELKQAVLRQAYDLEMLHEYYPHLYTHEPIYIYSAIMEDYRRAGAHEQTLKQIAYIFSAPEYNKYRYNIYSPTKKKGLVSNIKEHNMLIGERFAADSRATELVSELESYMEQPVVQAFMERMTRERHEKQAQARKQRTDDERFTIPKPDWIPEGVDGVKSETYFALIDLQEVIQQATTRVYQYPPKNKEDDLYYAKGVRTMADMLRTSTDLKFVRDTISYLEIVLDRVDQSIHASMSHSKIQSSEGEDRPVTREHISDITPKYIQLALDIIDNLPAYIRFCLYQLREQKPYAAQFHLDRHEKLSDSAFSNSTFMNWDEIKNNV